MIPAQNIEAAVHEVRRAKAELGFKAVFLRPNPVCGRDWHDPAYDAIWAECEKQDLAVGFHEGTPCACPSPWPGGSMAYMKTSGPRSALLLTPSSRCTPASR